MRIADYTTYSGDWVSLAVIEQPVYGKVFTGIMRMREHGSSEFAQERNGVPNAGFRAGEPQQWVNPLETDLSQDEDMVMEQILENIHNTPLGQVLKKIASLPEVRRQKVLRLRRQITEGKYDLSDRLDMALDKVLEDLIA